MESSSDQKQTGQSFLNEELMTEGERYSKRYFDENGLLFEKGYPLGNKSIDFLVHTKNGDVLWENADFGESELDRGAQKAAIQTFLQFEHIFKPGYVKQLKDKLGTLDDVEASNAGSWNPIGRVQPILRDKSKQLLEAKGKIPTIVVICNLGSAPADYDLLLRQGLEGDRFFNKDRNTTISALAVLSEVGGKMRLRIYHNPHASKAIPPGSFPGERTVELSLDDLWGTAIDKGDWS
jgi:hypothetical protein